MVNNNDNNAIQFDESEVIFHEIVENISEVVIKLQIDGKMLYISPQVKNLLGYLPSELLNQEIIALVHPDDIPEVSDWIREALTEGQTPAAHECRVRHKNGQYRAISIQSKRLTTGIIPKIICIITDKTDIKGIQDKLSESEAQYKLIAENVEDVVAVFDRKLRLIYINEGQQKVSGFTKEEVMNQSAMDYIHPEDLPRILILFQEALKKGAGQAEYRIRRKDNTFTWLETRARGIVDIHGEKGLILTSRQIDSRKKIEQKLKESEEMYRLISENANDLIIIENLNFELDYINRQPLKALLGYSSEELIGVNSLAYIHPEDRRSLEAIIRQAIERGEGDTELRIRHKDGHYLWFEAKGRTFINERGEKKLVIISRDITSQKQAAARLAESEAKYRLITENIRDLITIIDQRMGIEYVNNSTHQVFNGSLLKNSALNEELEHIHPEDRSIFLQLINDCFKTDEVKTRTFRLQDAPAHYLWFETTANTYKDEKGEKKLLAISHDITERQLMLHEIKRQNEELQKLDQLKEEFYADITHELRTPLTVIRGYAELLLQTPTLAEPHRPDIKTILRHEERLERLIDELLEYSRIKSSTIKFKKTRFRISELLDSLLADLIPLIDSKRMIIRRCYEPNDEVATDKNQIYKVIRNLLTNAIKFSYPNGIISIFSHLNNSFWIFSVQDHGIGIPLEDLSNIFLRFTKLKSGQEQNTDGLGLGLALSKRIIEALGGRIWAESPGLGKGATFTFQIDLHKT